MDRCGYVIKTEASFFITLEKAIEGLKNRKLSLVKNLTIANLVEA
jgi:hypothetical protein